MNIIELAKQEEILTELRNIVANNQHYTTWTVSTPHLMALVNKFLQDERDAIMKSIEELRPVEDNPLLQNKPAAFWIENFRQIVYTRGGA